MRDARIAAVAGDQFNRVTLEQLTDIGLSDRAVRHRVEQGRLVAVHQAVFAVAPVAVDDDWGRWKGATLTEPNTFLAYESALAAWQMLDKRSSLETVVRPGNGGPRVKDGLRVHHSQALAGETTLLRGVPITTPERTLIDSALRLSVPALARAVREAVRLRITDLSAIAECIGRHRRRRGTRRVGEAIARYSGLPLASARSGAEVRAMELLRDAGRPLPRLNVVVAGLEADLSWPGHKLIIEIDGGPFHLDVGEDRRKQTAWETAGWTVLRLPAAAVYEEPHRLLTLAPRALNVPRYPS